MERKAVSGIIVALLLTSMIGISMIEVTALEIHDIAITSVTLSTNTATIGETVSINVTVVNEGTETETSINVTVYYGDTIIKTQTITELASSASQTLIFSWDTSNVTAGTYTIKAVATPVPGETDTLDNTLISPTTVDVVSLYIAVLPRSTIDETLTPGQSYTVSIHTNYDGSDIWGYEFTLTYNPLVLHGVEVVNGDLITRPVTTFVEGNFNNTAGTLSKTGAYALNMTPTPPVPLASTGPGILVNITFTIVGEGESFITLGHDTLLMDTDGEGIIDYLDDLSLDPTKGKFLHGYFRNAPPAIHDVSVTNVEPSVTLVVKGEPATIDVTIRNKGEAIESVSVGVYYGYNPISDEPLYLIGSPKTVTDLENGTSTIVQFIWNTTDAVTGTHALMARVGLLSGLTDINPVDNTLKRDDAVVVYARSDLLDDYNDLLDSYDNLETYFDSLNSSYYGLESNYESLNSTYHALLNMYSQLQSDYNDSKSKHDTLTGDLGTTRNLSYLFIITTIVFIATTVYLTIRKPKAKPESKTT